MTMGAVTVGIVLVPALDSQTLAGAPRPDLRAAPDRAFGAPHLVVFDLDPPLAVVACDGRFWQRLRSRSRGELTVVSARLDFGQ
jgi:hypothetical protein